jgi:hypothetical protein
VSLANTQPFARELEGRTHIFAHDGDLTGIESSITLDRSAYRSVGQTDSELAFCALLARLTALWLGGDPPPLESRLSMQTIFAAELRALGSANFHYAQGDALFVHGDRRLQRSGRAEPTGPWVPPRRCSSGPASADQGAGLSVGTNGTSVDWVASVPLTDDLWQPRKSQRSPGLVIPECAEISLIRYGCWTPKLAQTTANTTLIHNSGTRGVMNRMLSGVPINEPSMDPFSIDQERTTGQVAKRNDAPVSVPAQLAQSAAHNAAQPRQRIPAPHA